MVSTYATIIVATIAGAFSLLGLIIAKEQKVSEFRQQWIDALRQDVAEFVAQGNIIHAALLKLAEQSSPDKTKFLADNRESYVGINRASTSIRLRLNATESSSKALLNAIRRLEAMLVGELETLHDSSAELEKLNLEIEEHAAVVLKSEWESVKTGERQYIVAKWGAGLLFVGCLIVIAFAIVSVRRLGFWN